MEMGDHRERSVMKLEVLADVESVARHAAEVIAGEARAAVKARGRFTVAISGGRTPWLMLRALSSLGRAVEERPRAAGGRTHRPRGSRGQEPDAPARESARPGQPGREQIHAMPVESSELDDAAARYAQTLVDVAGSPPVLDLVHLGLGSDGHTASLVPGDPVLDVTDTDVALTGVYQGRRRMTLTYPAINRARRVLWLITGEDKAAMLVRLRRGDPAIPAGRVRQDHAIVLADRAAAQQLATSA